MRKYEVLYVDTNEIKEFSSLGEAQIEARRFCGNTSFSTLPDGTMLYGPGDGTCSVMVRIALSEFLGLPKNDLSTLKCDNG